MYRTHSRQPDTGAAETPSGSAAGRINAARAACNPRARRAAPFRLMLLLAAALFAGQPLMAPAAENINWPGDVVTSAIFWGTTIDVLAPSETSPTHNTVTVSDIPAVPNVFGGFSIVTNEEVSDNRVFISGGEISDAVTGGSSDSGNAVRNKVEITGGIVDRVYGGWGGGGATDNTVNISGNPTIVSTLQGGFSLYGGNTFTGNTLNFSADPVTVAMVGNFQHYNFTLDSDTPGTPLIAANSIALGSSGTSSEIKVTGFRPSGQVLQVNDTFVLMETTNLTNNGSATSWTNTFQQGSQIYDVEVNLVTNPNQIIATITGIRSASTPATAIPALPAPLLLMLAVAAGLLGRRRLRQRA